MFALLLTIVTLLSMESLGETVVLNEDYTLSFSLLADKSGVRFNTSFTGVGYTAIGFSFGGTSLMVGPPPSISVIAVPDSESVNTYQLASKSLNGVRVTQDSSFRNMSYTKTSGGTIMKFTRLFKAQNGFSKDSPTILIWSHGSSDRLQYHGPNRGAIRIQFKDDQGAVGIDTAPTGAFDLRLWHGFSMVTALNILGYGMKEPVYKLGNWFLVHKLLQLVGLIFALSGFLLAVIYVSTYGSNFSFDHHIIGLAVTIVFVCQPFMALFRGHPPTPRSPITTRRLCFRICHPSFGVASILLGNVNAYLGLEFLDQRDLVTIILRVLLFLANLQLLTYMVTRFYIYLKDRTRPNMAGGVAG